MNAIYNIISLNGAWEMDYCRNSYNDKENPWKKGTVIENAVPGYWEDMTDAFAWTPFYRHLQINPAYGIQKYPITGEAPDMALPNIVGNFFYRRTFLFADEGLPTVIHFEGVQNAVSVWLNDVFLARHEGYSTPFDVKIPEGVLKHGENVIVLSVSNHTLAGYAGRPVSGLTNRAANEYTGGVTGDVELRVYTGPLREVSLVVSPDCEEVTVKVDMAADATYDWAVYDGEALVKSGSNQGLLQFDTKGLERWSPEKPTLYTLQISCGEGTLTRRFGIRRLTVDGVHFQLNGLPYYLRGICEHCYFPETIHPTHDISFYRNVIKKLKSLGFNFIRFHTYIPPEEYMQAADELGMLLQVESPNNTALSEWREIVNFCSRHTSVVIYCCGNELQIDDPFVLHLEQCAKVVHEHTDALFSPMSALRGLEYILLEKEQTETEPMEHNPRRFQAVGAFSDLYSSYALGLLSYESLDADPVKIDGWSSVYNHKPRVSHEICIDGTYTDLSLKDRYKGTRIERTEMFSSIERHLEAQGILKNAPLYFRNSSEWQRRVRKYCFEAIRRCENMAGYDFLGPIDTHWHTFGYDVGMMNEFYELKPGETQRNVLMYNSSTIVLTDFAKHLNYTAGEKLTCGIYASHYGKEDLHNARLTIRLMLDGKVVEHCQEQIHEVPNGRVSRLCDFGVVLPKVTKPGAMKLYVTLDGGDVFAENEWELYLFPEVCLPEEKNVLISEGMSAEELLEALREGRDVLLLGTEPFVSLPTSFRISLAGRTAGNLATVIYDHPVMKELPHEGFCGWQFGHLLEGGNAVCFKEASVPFHPIIEVVSTHKFAIRQSILFEFRALRGRVLVCGFRFHKDDPASQWLKAQLISYVESENFHPHDILDEGQLHALIYGKVAKLEGNTNFAVNANDKTSNVTR